MTGPYNQQPHDPYNGQSPYQQPQVTNEMVDAELARSKRNKLVLLGIAAIVGLLVIGGFIGQAVSGSGDSDKVAATSSTAVTADPAKATTFTQSPEEKAAAEQRAAEAKAKRDAELAAAQEKLRAQTDPATYEQITERDWLLIAKDPDAHIGRKVALYGAVTQFDSGTGTDTFRANTGAEPQDYSYKYDTNTIVSEGTPGLFDQVVKDDLVTLYVEIVGALDYDTTIGGSATAPMVNAYVIEVTGSDA